MVSMSAVIDAMLVRSNDVCGGRLRISDTRVTVNQIATLYKQGEPPEEIAAHFPHVSLAQIFAALTYYHANRDEVERDIERERLEAERIRTQLQGRQ